MTFRKYEKTYRIETDDFPAKGKAVLPEEEEKRLFRGEVIINEKLDGCLHYTSRILLEGGNRTNKTEKIGKIVNNRLDVKVMSYNEKENVFELKKILKYHKYKNNNQKFLVVRMEPNHGQERRLNCTPNHKFLTDKGWISAENLKKGDFVFKYKNCLDEVQKQIIYGTLLGDSCLLHRKQTKDPYPNLKCRHSKKQEACLDLKIKILSNLFPRKVESISGYGSKTVEFVTKTNDGLKDIFDKTYKDRKKHISKKWMDELTPLSLAFWYMDDGSLNKANVRERIIFSTYSFDENEHKLLVEMLKDKFNIDDCTVVKTKKGNILTIGYKGTKRFLSLVSPYICNELGYKSTYPPPNVLKNYVLSPDNTKERVKVKGVEEKNTNIMGGHSLNYAYDLTVEDNKNYIANGIIVHNSSTAIRKENGKIYLQKRGSDIDLSHYQYKYLVKWAYENTEKLMKLPDNIIVYTELLICVHTVYYDHLSDHVLVFDIFDLKKKEYLAWEEVVKVCKDSGLSIIPLIYKGSLKKKDIIKIMPEKSAFGKIAEGIVIKNYKEQLRGKVVKPQFIKEVNEGDFWRNKKIQLNEVVKNHGRKNSLD